MPQGMLKPIVITISASKTTLQYNYCNAMRKETQDELKKMKMELLPNWNGIEIDWWLKTPNGDQKSLSERGDRYRDDLRK